VLMHKDSHNELASQLAKEANNAFSVVN
jgi:hypothetical protein